MNRKTLDDFPQLREMYHIRYSHEDNEHYILLDGVFFNIPSDALVDDGKLTVDISLPFCKISLWKNNKMIHITMYSVGYRDFL